MKITYEMLVEKDACEEVLEWFKTTFPDGCELNDETINNLCSNEYKSGYIWWFYNNVQQDARLYRLCGVNWSSGVNWSDGVNRSDGVNESFRVNRSAGVNWSDRVNWSNGVNESAGVNWSNGVNRSVGVNESAGINGSFGVINSYGVDHALFLADKPREYTIFGSKVSKDRFSAVHYTLISKLNGWRPVFNNIEARRLGNSSSCGTLTPTQKAENLSKQEAWAGMPKEAIDYVASLPEFDADMFFKITGITILKN